MRRNDTPAFLKAKTPEDLRLLMHANNTRHGKLFHYFDFQFVKGLWYCWYELSIKDEVAK